jgi:putative pyruvate formate lyase activating enzyme
MIENNPAVYENDLIKKGVIVRHLVLPQASSDSKKIIEWFAPFKEKASISIMSQYTPYGDLENFPELKRTITKREYNSVIDYALSLGIENVFVQDKKSANEVFIPKWDF